MKNLKLLSFSIFCLFIAFVMVGCGTGDNDNSQNNSPKACSHNYVSSTVEPTCTAQGYTLHTCSLCGNKYEDNYISATGHNYVEGERNFACSKCGKSECDGFTFKTATYNGENCYVITNATGSVLQNGVLGVPRKYESLPVRGIMNWAFSNTAQKVKKIIIHSNIKNIYSDIWHGTSIWDPDWETICSLEEIVFDSNCCDMRIEAGAFNNCQNLKKANISKGMIKYAPADAVMSSNGGNAEWIFGETPFYKNNATVKNGLHYIADLLVHADPNEVNSSIVIDDKTVMLNAALFARITFIKFVTIPNTVVTIGEKAFYGCNSLESITFNGTVEEFQKIAIGPSAFSGTKAKKIICSNGEVTTYRYNGYTYYIGE